MQPADLTTAKDILSDARAGVVGIDNEGNVFGGYEFAYEAASAQEEMPALSASGCVLLPPGERAALADEMIRRWADYKEKAQKDE